MLHKINVTIRNQRRTVGRRRALVNDQRIRGVQNESSCYPEVIQILIASKTYTQKALYDHR